MKRILSLILALVLAVSLLPAAQAAPARGFASASGANPLYPHLQAPAPVLDPMAQPRPVTPNATYKSFDDAAVDYREAMEDRQSTVYLYLRVEDPNYTYDPYYLDVDDLLERAFTETGVPTEGDSLRWVWNTYSASWGWSYSNNGWNIDLTVQMTYYTTMAQEKELTKKVDEILDSFNFNEDTSDYRKVKTIYDYITDNVVYDFEHVNDNSYKLQFTAYAAACQGVAVCQGYAVLFYRMLLEEDICARVVTGWGGGPHAWNIVELDGLFYNCDSTWDAGMSSYGWFLLSPANFTDHSRNPEYETSAFHSRYPMDDQNYVPPHEHTYSPWTVTDATCTADGSRVRTCSGCGKVETVVLPALGHDYASVVTAPTCTEAGFTTHTCSRCADTYTDAPVEALGHRWDEGFVTIVPTEEAAGLLVYTCTVCAATNEVTLQPHVHDYTEAVVVEPGCESQGYTRHTCPGCGHFYSDSYVDALGHDWELDSCIRCGGERPNPFTDTDPSRFYYLPVLWAVDNNITQGTGNGKFSPDGTCNRAQVVTFLWRAAGSPAPVSSENPFTDVSPERYYYTAVLWAVEKNITQGTGDGKFSPDGTCTRGQVVTFLWRAAGSEEPTSAENPFTDVSPERYYHKAVLWAVEKNITQGTGKGLFSPDNTCTRGHVVTFLYRTFA